MKTKRLVAMSGLGITVFLISLSICSPKKELLYKTESILLSKKIDLQNKDITDFGVAVSIENPSLKILGNDAITGGEGCFFASFVYNSYSISNPKISEISKAALGVEPTHIKLYNSVFIPSKIWIKADGEFGSIKGTIDLKQNKFRAKLYMSQAFETADEFKAKKGVLLSKFKQTEEGFVYESDI